MTFNAAPFPHHQYNVSSDGQRFLLNEREEEAMGAIHVALNWFEELKRLVPPGE